MFWPRKTWISWSNKLPSQFLITYTNEQPHPQMSHNMAIATTLSLMINKLIDIYRTNQEKQLKISSN